MEIEEIKCGEYVRTEKGIIYKADQTYYLNNSIPIKFATFSDRVTKHSPNIFELLVEGDFVELEYYIKTRRGRSTRRFEIKRFGNILKFDNMYCIFHYDLQEGKWLDGKGYNPKIKRIVTREKFESIGYEV